MTALTKTVDLYEAETDADRVRRNLKEILDL